MEYLNIKKLLDKYENGTTSIAEENSLRSYFKQEHIPPELEVYRPLFNYFQEAQNEKFNKEIVLKTPKPMYKYLKYSVAVAATLIVLVGVSINNKALSTTQLGTIEQPEVAYKEVVKSLKMISEHLNKGTKSVAYLNTIENTTKLVFKK